MTRNRVEWEWVGLPPGGQAWYRRPGGKRAVRAWKVGEAVKPGAVHLFVRARWRWVPESWLCVPKSLTGKQKKVKEKPCMLGGGLL